MTGTIVVGGSVAQRPGHGGHAWVFLQYLLGFKRLGWDVLFVDRFGAGMTVDVAWLADVMDRFGLGDQWALLDTDSGEVVNLSRRELSTRLARAAFLLNVMGYVDDESVLGAVPMRVFLDIDPGFGHMWRALDLHDPFVGHDAYVTIGENVGRPGSGCTIPTGGIDWITTKQPVVLDQWPLVAAPGATDAFTSVVSWRGPFGPIEYEGEVYGLRVHEFRRFLELPARTGARFELALDIDEADNADLERLHTNGWTTVDPRVVAGSVDRYREFVQSSAAELMVAKNLYVRSRSGWFSDRSACYLASGRPVVAQDTGLGDIVPHGEGLLLFDDMGAAVDAVKSVSADWSRHSEAARAIAEAHFSSDVVLGRLLAQLGFS